MTDVELSRLLTDLGNTAEALNRESDTINALIDQFGAKLQGFNVGIEVWLEIESHESDAVIGENYGEDIVERRSVDTELGFMKLHDKWQLAIRSILYRKDDRGDWEMVRIEEEPARLLDASRQHRLAALKLFPNLVTRLHQEARAALETIQSAKKVVK